jgi:hypothetical protein
MINPDFHLTLYISEEVFKVVSGAIVCVVAIWATVKLTDILFGKRYNNTTTPKDSND